MWLSMNNVNVPTGQTLASSRFVGFDILIFVSCRDCLPRKLRLLSGRLYADLLPINSHNLVLLHRWFSELCWLEPCSSRWTRRREGFESETLLGTVLLSIPCTTQIPDARIFLMQLCCMLRPTCSLVGGRFCFRFHERVWRLMTRKVRLLLKLIFSDVVCLNFTHLVRISSFQGSGLSRGRSAAANGHVPILGSVKPSTLVRSVGVCRSLDMLTLKASMRAIDFQKRLVAAHFVHVT